MALTEAAVSHLNAIALTQTHPDGEVGLVCNDQQVELEQTVRMVYYEERRNQSPSPSNHRNASGNSISVSSRCTTCHQSTGTPSDSYALYHRNQHIFQDFAAAVIILDRCSKAPQARNMLGKFGVKHAGEKHWALAKMAFARGLSEGDLNLWWPEDYSPLARWVHGEYVARHQPTGAVYDDWGVNVRGFDWRWYVSELMEESTRLLGEIDGENALPDLRERDQVLTGLRELFYRILTNV
ncbi:hypothetical protein LTR37_019592 [Vermiconidia calcicola]|uniref:Uncharacterized protein n=1 Tax=Vermiconidia calcicola TaxID=1690605 RepID=A0ACC3MEW0_9PEZI|nr:hypothetical protein LTR37_019592 [Vermiconidia calcicola]